MKKYNSSYQNQSLRVRAILKYLCWHAILTALVLIASCKPSTQDKTENLENSPCTQILNDAKRISELPINVAGSKIPNSYDESLQSLDLILTPQHKQYIRCLDEKKVLSELHFGLGRWIRNNWGLYSQSKLWESMNNMGISHPDDISTLIIENYYYRLQGRSFPLQERIKRYQQYWMRKQR